MQEGKDPRLWVKDLASSETFAQAPEARKRLVHAAHIRILYELSHLAALVSLVVVILVGLAFHDRVDTLDLWLWGLATTVIAAARYLVSRHFMHSVPSDSELPWWGRLAVTGSFLQAVAWGGLVFLVSGRGAESDVFVVLFVLCAFSFGAFATLGFYLPTYLSFAVPIFAAILAWFYAEVPEVSVWMGLLMVVAIVVMSQAGARATRVLRGALLLSYERDAWARQLKEEKERIQVTLGAIDDGVISTDTDGRVRYLNAKAERLTGWRFSQIEGRPLSQMLKFKPDPDGEPVPDLVAGCLGRGEPLVVPREQTLAVSEHGEDSLVQVKASPIKDPDAGIIGAVVVLHDVTELSGMAQAMSYQARHDALTGLLNRKAFEGCLAEALEYVGYDGQGHALCYLDLDQFKIVNDTCGHIAGDELLKHVAEALKELIRETDVMARLGGDEFGILLYRCSAEKAREVADTFVAMIRDFRFTWEDKVFNVGVSIGVVPVDADGSTPTQLLAAADAACYVAKDLGRNRIHVTAADDTEVASRHGEMQLTSQIQRALDDDGFRLRFQRIVPLGLDADGPVKVELLASMRGQGGQLLPPGAFLPAAERFSMMHRLDRHIVAMGLDYAVSGISELKDVAIFSINLSGQSLADDGFLAFVTGEFERTGVDPTRICFEITETAVITNLDRAMQLIAGLRAAGCKFALDDFGSGLSSFGYLRRLPVDYLKIDGQFVRDMSIDPVNRSMVQAINQVGQIMGLKTIAEFVEDEPTMAVLREIGVDFGQGYGIHKPELLPELHLERAEHTFRVR